MAGVSREWINQSRGESALTFAIVTTKANAKLILDIQNEIDFQLKKLFS